MPASLKTTEHRRLRTAGVTSLPRLIVDTGEQAARRLLEFFAANIRNPGTRVAYARAAVRFSDCCEARGVPLPPPQPVIIARTSNSSGR